MHASKHWLGTPMGGRLYVVGGTLLIAGLAAALQGSLWPPQGHAR